MAESKRARQRRLTHKRRKMEVLAKQPKPRPPVRDYWDRLMRDRRHSYHSAFDPAAAAAILLGGMRGR